MGQQSPPGGVGTTDGATIYTGLLAEGVDAPPGAMDRILEELSAEGQLTGVQAVDREGSYTVPGQSLNPSGGCDLRGTNEGPGGLGCSAAEVLPS